MYLFILITVMANFLVFELSSMSQIVHEIILCIFSLVYYYMSFMFWLWGLAVLKDIAVLSLSFIQLVGNPMNENVWSFVLDFERDWYPIASRTAGTHDYAPVCSIGDQFKLNLIWKMFPQTMFTLHTTTVHLGCNHASLLPTLYFMLNTFYTRNHSVKAWFGLEFL